MSGFLTTFRPFSPAGPVAAASLAAWGPVNLLKGPPGSAKTSNFIFKALAGTMMQNPYPDGVRRARLWVLAIDYRRLWGNFIPSVFEWIPQHDPENGVEWVGSRGGPALQTVSIKDPRGQVSVLDGPFADTKELFGGFFWLQNVTREQALALAAECPAAAYATIEVRELGPCFT